MKKIFYYSHSLFFDGFKLAIIDMYLNNNPQKTTLSQKIQKQRDKSKLKSKVNQTDIIITRNAKSTLRNPLIEIGSEADIDKQAELASIAIPNLK